MTFTRTALLGALLLAPGCAPGDGSAAEAVRVYAAVSLKAPLTAARQRLEEVAGAPISFNFGASNDLARQIAAARRADLFLSADEHQMDLLMQQGLIETATRRSFLSNTLVVVIPAGASPEAVRSAAWLTGPAIRRLSLADPSGVPAGRYAAEWLKRAGVWEQVRRKVAPAIDARAALAAVESGGAQAGVVYETDAALSDRVRVVLRVDGDEGPVITYAAAMLSGGRSEAGARRLLEFLTGEGATETFGSYGFTTP